MSDVTTVRGHSDDVIELEGAISDEFGAYDAGEPTTRYLSFDNGVILSIVYGGEGIWSIRVLAGQEYATKVFEASDPAADYSDPSKPTPEELEEWSDAAA